MQLNHCVNAAINLPVALFMTASGMPPTALDDTPEAAEEEWVSEEEIVVGPAAEVLPLVRGVAALRHMHSSN